MWFTSSINIWLIFVLHVESGAQFLNATSILLYADTFISPATKINSSR